MKRKNLLILFAVLLLIPASGFALPHLAVLDAVMDAGIDPSAGPLVTSKIEEAFVNSGKYVVLDRANIDRVLQEKEFQLSSGIVRNEEVRRAGEYLGADAVVVATVSRIGQTYVVSAKMIDVVSGEIAAQTSAEKSGRVDVLLEVARMVGGRLAGTDIFIVSVDEERAQEIVKDEKKAETPPPAEEPEVVKEEEVEEEYVPLPPRKKPWDKNLILGVRGGLNASTVGWDTDWYSFTGLFDLDSKSEPYLNYGVNGGVYMVVNTGPYLAWQIELDFSQKGYAIDITEFDDVFIDYYYGQDFFVFNYLEMPVLMKLKIPGTLSPYALLGVYLSFWLSGTVELVEEDADYQDFYESYFDNPTDLEDYWGFSSFDAGWVIGAGLDLFLSSLVLNLEVKYSGGMLTMDDFELLRNSTLTATVGLGFAF